jgi:hypothetical protein
MTTTGQKAELLAGRVLNVSILRSPVIRHRDATRTGLTEEQREGLTRRGWWY